MQEKEKTTHFGFRSVPWQEKDKAVADVFHSVASRYDQMNDLMSFGIHRLWKRYAIHKGQLRPGQRVLDLAGGSGDLSKLASQQVGASGEVVLADINAAMLAVGRDRLTDAGCINNVRFVQANAQALPFPDHYFHCITIAFGLRNVTDKEEALRAMYRVCRPGGKLMVLEFSQPVLPGLKPVYDWYSFNILPRLGQWIAGDRQSYQYLGDSIPMHPYQLTLKAQIEAAGFADCQVHNLSGGIVALHLAWKY
ncbi:MAG: bifunctional demethylmenaquinone methyltransferase/2-methoxy-6-polyprenyl-1,4-benzoquinol methylase UbiE [Legionellaceae bacterium]|nr:bifunctional demethylmenaquinone methyltransferase/2-methoxy-6-polyprenyl-1,4-benzoquinol methylase UbiE [Legionellaceae bacterium]